MSTTVTNDTAHRFSAQLLAGIGATVLFLVAAFLLGRQTASEGSEPFEGTVTQISYTQNAVQITTPDGEKINGVLANTGVPLDKGEQVTGRVYEDPTIVFVDANAN